MVARDDYWALSPSSLGAIGGPATKTKGRLTGLSPYAFRAFTVNDLTPLPSATEPKSKRRAFPPVTATAGETIGAATPLIVTYPSLFESPEAMVVSYAVPVLTGTATI